MTSAEFKRLTFTEQAEVLNKYGVFLAQRVIASNRIYLYAISAFYIELLHVLNGSNMGINIFRIFDDPHCLDAYTKTIEEHVVL